MAAAFLNALVAPGRAEALAAGTQPAPRVPAEIVAAMNDVGIDISTSKPQLLTPELASGASVLITLGCGEQCPVIQGAQREYWPLPDPKVLSPDAVAAVRAKIRARVGALLEANGWTLAPE